MEKLDIGSNLKVGDKFIKKDKQVLTIKKIVGDQIYLESNKFEVNPIRIKPT